tara:strand:+ start:1829 stop:2821 length:993 start_codon:yes stop_codon:yes gene_type:complete
MSEDTTVPTSVNQAMTAAQAANAIEAMLSGDGDQQEDEATQDESQDESEQVEDEIEDVEQDADSEDDDEADESDEDVDEDEAEDEQQFTVKIDGKDVAVSLDELQKGYSRTEDYTRKTQALAQERKTAQAELEQVRTERSQYAQLLGALQEQLQQPQQSVDMERLRDEDPIEWVRQREMQRENNEKLLAIQSEQQRINHAEQGVRQQQMQAFLQSQKEQLLSVVPQLSDPKFAQVEKSRWIEAGKSIGFSEQELNGINDHRVLLALKRIADYNGMVAKRKQVTSDKPQAKTVKPGTGTRKHQSSSVKSAQQRLARSGNAKDAASLLENFL